MGPLDLIQRYVTGHEVLGDRYPITFVQRILRRVPVKDALMAIASVMAAIRAPAEISPIGKIDRDSIPFFNEEIASRLERHISAGAVIHAPQLIMVLAKLIIAECPEHVEPENQLSSQVPLPLLLLIVADNLSTSLPAGSDEASIPLVSDFSLEMTANQIFNASYREDSQMAFFQRRWIEMPSERVSAYFSDTLEQAFLDATEIQLRDFAALAVAFWVSCSNGMPLIDPEAYLAGFGWDSARIKRILSYICLPLETYRDQILRELGSHSLDWYFTTFARYPVVGLGREVLVLDPQLLLRRALGFFPFWDIEDGFKQGGRAATLHCTAR